MVRTLTVALFFIAGLFTGVMDCDAQSGSPTAELSREESAILEVIRSESAAFWEKDYEQWASYWVHAPYVRAMGWSKQGDIYVAEGWGVISEDMKKLMEQSPEPNPTSKLVRRENINIRVSNAMAFVSFDQYGVDTGDELMDMPGLARETRVLEKQDGQWKIIYVGWLHGGEEKKDLLPQ